jgi:hypothetical protein
MGGHNRFTCNHYLNTAFNSTPNLAVLAGDLIMSISTMQNHPTQYACRWSVHHVTIKKPDMCTPCLQHGLIWWLLKQMTSNAFPILAEFAAKCFASHLLEDFLVSKTSGHPLDAHKSTVCHQRSSSERILVAASARHSRVGCSLQLNETHEAHLGHIWPLPHPRRSVCKASFAHVHANYLLP